MPLIIDHVLHAERLELQKLGIFPEDLPPDSPERLDPHSYFFHISIERTFQVLYPGKLKRDLWATVKFTQREPSAPPLVRPPPRGIDDPGGRPIFDDVPRPLHNGVHVANESVRLVLDVFDPDGVRFTGDEITPDHLKRFRDARGIPRAWKLNLNGQSRIYEIHDFLHQSATDPRGHLELSLAETVRVTSGGPLLDQAPIVPGVQRFTLDLNRVGKLVAELVPRVPASIRLLAPDGRIVGSSDQPILTCPLTLATLGPHDPRKRWTLEIESTAPASIVAEVLGEGRIGVTALESRLRALLGVEGNHLQLRGKNEGGRAKLVLRVDDTVAAETLDMHGLLDSLLRAQGMSTDIERGVDLTLFSRDEGVDFGLNVDVSTVKISGIRIDVGESEHIPGPVPAVRVALSVSGAIKVKFGDLVVATATVRGGQARFELGLSVSDDGTPVMSRWVQADVLDIDISEEVLAVAVGLMLAGGGVVPVLGATALAVAVAEYIEAWLPAAIERGSRLLFDDPMLPARILMTLLGGHFHHFLPRIEDGDLLFLHRAPEERVPGHHFGYRAAIGRTVTTNERGELVFDPPSLGDTWAADNLKRKIKHIVVVMMENRSYDHVLGYRAQAPYDDGKDGVTPALVKTVDAAVGRDGAMRPLRLAGFESNAQGLKTRIPHGVGHALADMTEQLATQIPGPDGGLINSPHGFLGNFKTKHLHGQAQAPDGTADIDVLGYYEANDLLMYAFLAQNYAYSDRFFCAHPGPTLPNRMYWLTGLAQPDRFGQPILDNNHSDNFELSRATTIHDVLERHGVRHRTYESAPSVAMLRMFARYATDDDAIRAMGDPDGDDFSNCAFERDMRAGDVPPLVVIEPAMHHYPQNDDHPDADMWRGQRFIWRVYNALRQNDEVWKHTLLVITYDENGGLYDHVVPPVADVFEPFVRDPSDNPHRPNEVVDGPAPVAGNVAVLAMPVGVSGLDRQVLHPAPPTSPVGTVGPVMVRYGARVPTFLISPWIPADARPPLVLDHCSIMKTVLATFCGDSRPFLGDRINESHSFEAFVTAAEPRMDVAPPPHIPDLPHDGTRRTVGSSRIATPDLYRKRMREEQVDFHDLTGRLARMLGR